MADRGSGGEFARPVDFRLVGDEDNRCDALGMHLTHHMLRRERAVDFLPAGHGNRIVVENFVGHVDARRDALADREKARVEIGAIAEVDELVFLVSEMRRTLPLCALGTHL